MVAELDPVRPVHPTWPGRRVPEEGDEPKRHRRREADEDPDRSDEHGGGEDSGEQAGGRPASPGPDGIGHHVDEYA